MTAMKSIITKQQHSESRSHVCKIVEYKGNRYKITYEAYNAAEKCTVSIFGGDGLGQLFCLRDLGYTPNSDAYILSPEDRRSISIQIIKTAETMIKASAV